MVDRGKLETTVLICVPVAIVAYLVVLVEVSISLGRTPCDNWPNSGQNCSFAPISGSCGLSTRLSFDMQGLFYFSPDATACVVTIVCSACGFALAVLLLLLLLFLFCRRATNATVDTDSDLIQLELGTGLACIVWLLCLIVMLVTTIGYTELCQKLATPRCSSDGQYNAWEFNCHKGLFDLLTCSQLHSETFVGRLLVSVVLAWIGLAFLSLATPCMIVLLNDSLSRLRKRRKADDKNRFVDPPLELGSHNGYLYQLGRGADDYYGQQETREFSLQLDDNEDNRELMMSEDEGDRTFLGRGTGGTFPPIPHYPSTDRVEDVIVLPTNSLSRSNLNTDVHESSF